MQKLDPAAAAAALDEFWSQQVIGEANGSLFKVAKGTGSINWHAHDDQDEVFLVLAGEVTMQLRDGDVELSPGEMFIVPRGVEHCLRTDGEVHLLLVGTAITSNAAGGKPDWSHRTPPGARA
ncbi:MAG TPA: cupin domain-containing protein [Gaiellales bacterium]